MLGSTNIVAFVPIKDSEKARAFYEGVLGLRFVKDDGFAMVLDANGIMIRAAKMKDFTPAQFTVLGWQVSDIENVVRALQRKGRALRDLRILQARRTRNLDRADRRQSGVVQRSGRKYPVGISQHVESELCNLAIKLESPFVIPSSCLQISQLLSANSFYSTFQPLTSTVGLAVPNSLAR